MAAEPERVVERRDVALGELPWSAGGDVEVDLRVLLVQVGRGRDEAVAHRQDREDGLDGARATVQVEDKTVNLTAGMAVSLEVKTGKRRVIEYFLSPLLQRGSESLRER